MAKRNPSPEQTRLSIRRETVNLISYNGVHATGLMDIAKAAGISKGTLYYHYTAKESLILEIAQEHFAALTAIVYEWIDGLDTEAALKAQLPPLAHSLFPDEDTMRLHFALLNESMRVKGELSAFVSAKQREWAVILELGTLRLSKPGRLKDFGRTVVALINSYALNTLLGEDIDILFLLSMVAGEM